MSLDDRKEIKMGINFGDIGGAPAANPTAAVETGTAQQISTPQGITLDLDKGAILDLSKQEPGLQHVKLGAGWDVASAGTDFDLDISAFALNSNGKITSVNDVIYFKHPEILGIKLNGDNRTGEGDGDDETIDVDLSLVPAQYSAIAFVVNIYEAQQRRQTFGMVNNSYVRLLNTDAGNKEICRFVLKDDYSTSTGVIFAKLKREGSAWKFEAVGDGKVVKDLNDIAAMFS